MAAYGPSGGIGGIHTTGFQNQNPLSRIRIWSATYVHAIEFIDNLGNTYTFGNTATAPLTADVTLQAGDYVSGVDGNCGEYVDSISIHTFFNQQINAGGYGGITHYYYDAQPGGIVTGVWGRTGYWIDAIGIFVSP